MLSQNRLMGKKQGVGCLNDSLTHLCSCNLQLLQIPKHYLYNALGSSRRPLVTPALIYLIVMQVFCFEKILFRIYSAFILL